MISSKAVYDVQVVPQGLHVIPRTQHGAHLPFIVPQPLEIIEAEEEVMWSHLAGHLDAFLLSSLDDEDLREPNEAGKWTSYGLM